MKNIVIIFTLVLISFYGCSQANKQVHTTNTSDTSAHYISQMDAEKILGQPVSLTESSVEKKENAAKYRYTYTANDSTKTDNRTAHL